MSNIVRSLDFELEGRQDDRKYAILHKISLILVAHIEVNLS